MSCFNFSTCAFGNDSLYIVSSIDESLYQMSLDSFKPNLITDDPNFVSDKNDLAHKIYFQDNNIVKWCVGSKTGYIKIHNLLEHCTEEIQLFEGKKTIIIPNKNKIVALCLENGMIKEYDLSENRISYLSENASRDICNIKVNPVFYYATDNMGYAYFLSSNPNCIYKFDIANKRFENEYVPPIHGNIELIGCEADTLYFYTNQGDIYALEKGTMKCIAEGVGQGEWMFSSILPTSAKLVLIPYKGKDIIIIDKFNGSVSAYKDVPQDIAFQNDNYIFFDVCTDENTYYVSMPTTNYYIKVSYDGMITWHQPNIKKSDLISIMLKNNILTESKEIDLMAFISNI